MCATPDVRSSGGQPDDCRGEEDMCATPDVTGPSGGTVGTSNGLEQMGSNGQHGGTSGVHIGCGHEALHGMNPLGVGNLLNAGGNGHEFSSLEDFNECTIAANNPNAHPSPHLITGWSIIR